jgi:hypothetical protein
LFFSLFSFSRFSYPKKLLAFAVCRNRHRGQKSHDREQREEERRGTGAGHFGGAREVVVEFSRERDFFFRSERVRGDEEEEGKTLSLSFLSLSLSLPLSLFGVSFFFSNYK